MTTDTPNKEDDPADEQCEFEKLAASLKGLPPTWYPALLQTLVEESYKYDVWLPGGASRRVARIEEKIGRTAPDGEES